MTPSKQRLLTKSRFVNGLQCSKWIWLEFNRPEELPKTDEATQHRFDEGHKVGELAKSLFPDGINIEEIDTAKNHEKTKELLKKRKSLFEAGFIHPDGKCYARADILIPVGKNEWDILEVKSATSVKEEYIWDVAFQKYVYESAGLKIRNCSLMHINNQFVKQGEVKAEEFFIKADINDEVKDFMPEVPKKIKELLKIIELKECPEITQDNYCDDPLHVHDNDKFWKEHPECDVFDLYRGGKLALELFSQGILEIKNIPECHHHRFNDKHKIQHACAREGNHHVDKKELSSFIKSLKYPVYFLDFESYNTAIPLYNGLKPYQQICFQYSLHIIKKKGAKPEHFSFIAEGADDPRPEFMKSLKKNLGAKGSIVVYNQSFEQTRLKEMALFLPLYQKWVDSVNKRMVDLLIPFRNFAYYHPKQKGSASIKHVLPVLTGETYEDFEIANGSEASLSYLFITHGNYEGQKATPEEIKKVRTDLGKYCGQDTEGMIWILDKLNNLIK